MKISIFWFRRDLRLEDNTALNHALLSGLPVLPIFIFDQEILNELPQDDPRVNFIYNKLLGIQNKLISKGGSLRCLKGDPNEIWKSLIAENNIRNVFINKDYEPYAINRDEKIKTLLKGHGIELLAYKDQVMFEEDEILNGTGLPYTIFTPYKKKWLSKLPETLPAEIESVTFKNLFKNQYHFPSLAEIGFKKSEIEVRDFELSGLDEYQTSRDFPARDHTSYLGPHLRFGTISIRTIISKCYNHDALLSELIWREFFMQILFHFPSVVTGNFKSKYDNITWRNDQNEFEKWCEGKTGYPLVDAGMRQLNSTGYMHNRVRMITAGFLCKHLLIDWRWGEAYFAKHLLDYELSSNNGNWQWAAGTGCDSSPYFRIFNPLTQLKKFDPDLDYVKKWVREFGTANYPKIMIEHSYARLRALEVYKKGIR